jgi:hypothetical protein
VIDETRGAHYTIWLVALLLYVWDAAKLLSTREVLLVEARRGRLAPIFSENPFTLAGRILVFAPLLQPFRGAFVVPWGKAWSSPLALKATLQSLDALRSRLVVMRVLATWAFVVLFGFGPALTLLLGPDAAVLYTAGVIYPTVAGTIVVLWGQRHGLGITAARCTWLSAEMFICPAFLPNLVRKITALQPIDGDGAQILAATASADVSNDFLRRLESRAQELIIENGPDGSPPGDLRAYLVTIRSAR